MAVAFLSFNFGWMASILFPSVFGGSCFSTRHILVGPSKQPSVRPADSKTGFPGGLSTTTPIGYTPHNTTTPVTKPDMSKSIQVRVFEIPSAGFPPRSSQVNAPDDTVVNVSRFVNAPVPRNPMDGIFECIEGQLKDGEQTMKFPICIYDPVVDKYISATMKQSQGVVWEAPHVTTTIIKALGLPGEDIGCIDIGTNIGVFSLSVAHAGHQVISVEPMPSALRRLRHSITLGGIEGRVKVVQAALSNETGTLYMNEDNTNKGGSRLAPRSECVTNLYVS